MKIRTLYILALLAVSTGCAIHDGRPPVANYNPEAQHKLKSVTHWQIVADDIASQIEPVAKAGNQSVFVPTSSATSFSKVFSSQLRSSLLKKGVKVPSAAESGALVINVNVDEVRHVTLNRYKPGTLTALAAGVLVLREATDTIRSTIGAGAALLVAKDAYKFTELDKRPSTEIVITTTAEKNTQYAIHRTDAYYIDSVDSSLFTDTGHQFPVVRMGE